MANGLAVYPGQKGTVSVDPSPPDRGSGVEEMSVV